MQFCMQFKIGFPLRDLSRAYKEKLKKLLEGGYRVIFDKNTATQVLVKNILYYFFDNDKVHFV